LGVEASRSSKENLNGKGTERDTRPTEKTRAISKNP